MNFFKSNKKKRISIYTLLILITCSMFFLLMSCTSEESSISVVSFKTVDASYEYDEVLTFAVKIKNPKNYKVTSATINSKAYPVLCDDERYDTFYVTDNELKFTSATNTYTLSALNYIVNDNNNPKSETLQTDIKCYVKLSVQTVPDVTVTSWSVKSSSGEGNFYCGESVDITLNLNNPKGYSLDRVQVVISSKKTGEELANNTIPLFEKNMSSDNTVATFTLENLPSLSGVQNEDIDINIKRIFYTKNYQLINSSANCEIKTVNLQKRAIEILSFKIDNFKEETIFKDINNRVYTDDKSQINLKIEISNPSDLKITQVIINKTAYKNITVKRNNYMHIDTIEVAVSTPSTETEGAIKIKKLELNGIRYNDKTAAELEVPVAHQEEILVYDKIINNASDLLDLKINNGVIKGSYILAADLNLSDSNHHGFFSDYTFDGLLEGNGHTISFTSDANYSTKPLFKEIGENGVIKNCRITAGTFNNTNVLASSNKGTILNVDVSAFVCLNVSSIITSSIILTTDKEKKNTAFDKLGGLVGVNYGTISDIIVNERFELTGNTKTSNTYEISAITNRNYGNINRVVNNCTSVKTKVYKDDFTHSLFYLTAKENYGTISSMVYTLSDTSLPSFVPKIVTDSRIIGEEAKFYNVFINTSYLEKVIKADEDTYGKIDWSNSESIRAKLNELQNNLRTMSEYYAKGKDVADFVDEYEKCYLFTFNQDACAFAYATPKELGLSSDSASQISFYSNLGFQSGGTDRFWRYDSGRITFNFQINN